MKYHDRIFNIFQRLNTVDGIQHRCGPAIVRKSMERMGGRAWAEVNRGQGAAFYLKFRNH
jgi:light-regulated signal transduction histidine kinase (bacteriophytochrome)